MPRSHKSLSRLYVDGSLEAGTPLTLGREQSNYLISVMRLGAGESVILFNGRDGAWLATITDPGKKHAVLIPAVQTAHQTPVSDLWLGFAPLKAGRLDYLIQKATEMGAGIIQPVMTKFTQVKPPRADKMAANAIEAAEQCEVLSIPRIAPEVTLEALLASWQRDHGLRRLAFADEGVPSHSPLRALGDLRGLPVGLLIGPEGGFSDEERNLLHAQSFVLPISLGPRILRADTAAVAALAVLQASIGDWR
jgi:16S rRNA (uracil1498-N3)-methyltransferase